MNTSTSFVCCCCCCCLLGLLDYGKLYNRFWITLGQQLWKISRPMWQNPRQSLILDSRPWIPDPGYWILDSNLQWDSGFLELHSVFQSRGFRIRQAKVSRIQESVFPYRRRKNNQTTFLMHCTLSVAFFSFFLLFFAFNLFRFFKVNSPLILIIVNRDRYLERFNDKITLINDRE